MSTTHACPSCGSTELTEITGFGHLPRVTSDSKPFPAGGKLFVCSGCGLVQKRVDALWLEEIGRIYRDYEMYHQSTAIDQVVFDPVSGKPSGRCEILSRHLMQSGLLGKQGTLLDVGAGSGAMLSAFSGTADGWTLHGLDLDDRRKAALEQIPRFSRLYTVPPEQVGERFDLVSLIHSLEHFTDPVGMLRSLKERVAEGGKLFVQVNNAAVTPFDLVVADHLCHFSEHTLKDMVVRSGLGVALSSTHWINKELSLLAGASQSPSPSTDESPADALKRATAQVAWLSGVLDGARQAAKQGRIGLFGSSVAATWLAAGLGDAVSFFVDEDPGRAGRQHMGRPILRPDEVPAGSTVYLAFLRVIADSISQRLGTLPITWAAPSAALG